MARHIYLLLGDVELFLGCCRSSSGVDDLCGGNEASTFFASNFPIDANRFSKLLKKWWWVAGGAWGWDTEPCLKLIGSMLFLADEPLLEVAFAPNGDERRRRGEVLPTPPPITSIELLSCSCLISSSRLSIEMRGAVVFFMSNDLRRRFVSGFLRDMLFRRCWPPCGVLDAGLLNDKKFFSSNVVVGRECFLAANAAAAAAFFCCCTSLSMFTSRLKNYNTLYFIYFYL